MELPEIEHGTGRKWINGEYMSAARKIQGKLPWFESPRCGLHLEKPDKWCYAPLMMNAQPAHLSCQALLEQYGTTSYKFAAETGKAGTDA